MLHPVQMADLDLVFEIEGTDVSRQNGCEIETLGDMNGGDNRPRPDFRASAITINGENCSSGDSSSTCSMIWPLRELGKAQDEMGKLLLNQRKLERQKSSSSEFEAMKERFSKLLLGEDMSGCGNGVCTALAISNAITNLCATIFGQVWRLEPLQPEKKLMWRREMEWFLCVSNYIVELVPSWQTSPDGTKLEIMSSRPRSDLYINLPALRKLDNMLLDILDSFESSEFWYVDQGVVSPEKDESKSLPNQENKWWLPVPRLPPGGLSPEARKNLQHRLDCTNQILKAAMAINSTALAEMDVPETFLEALPKNPKACLGDLMHRCMNSDQFSPEFLLNFLDLSSDLQAVEIANRVESAIYICRRKTTSHNTKRSNSKSSWEMMKDLLNDGDEREELADKAESLLLYMKHKFPGLPQTTLDTSKIQHNKDVGKSILESYSRVLENLAFNIVARINDLLYVDDLSKHSDEMMSKISEKGKEMGIDITCPAPSKVLKPIYLDINEGFVCGDDATKRISTESRSSEEKGKDENSWNRRSSGSCSSCISRDIALGSSLFDSEEGITPRSDVDGLLM